MTYLFRLIWIILTFIVESFSIGDLKHVAQIAQIIVIQSLGIKGN